METHDDWSVVRSELRERLERLGAGDFVVLATRTQEAPAEQPRGWWRRLAQRPAPAPAPYVQVLHTGEQFRLELSDESGQVTDAAGRRADLVSVGWTPPDERPELDRGENWVAWAPLGGDDEASRTAVAGLSAWGLAAHGPWEWEPAEQR